MAYILWNLIFRPGFTSLVLSHKDDYAKANISRLKLMWAYLPEWMRRRLPEPNKASNTFKLDFGTGRVSEVVAMPATEKVGASLTLDFLFLDEFGLMEYAEQAWETLGPVLDAIAKNPRPGCVVAIGSTARGPANRFARMWRSSATRMKKLFFPWWCSPNYTQEDYDAELAEHTANGEPWKIHQERPATADEAFRKSGAQVFTRLPKAEECPEFGLQGRLSEDEHGDIHFTPDEKGLLRIAETPDPSLYYVLAVDPAHGKGVDATVGTVLAVDENLSPYICAYWASNIVKQEDAAPQLDLLGRWYAGQQRAALLVPETTGNQGELLIYKLRDAGYPNLYQHLQQGAAVRRRANAAYGINTAGAGNLRTTLIERVREYLPQLGNIYPTLLSELATFVERGEGTRGPSMAADVGCHDDHVLALAIGLWAIIARGRAPKRPLGETPLQEQVHSLGHLFNEAYEKQMRRELAQQKRLGRLTRHPRRRR